MTHIGTSGFNYPSWKNKFYPEKLPVSKWLEYYSSQFNTLELNSTFYKFPVLKNLKKFVTSTPEDFIITVKAHKIITHTMRMRNAAQKVEEYTNIVEEGLEEKLGCILFQLPPTFRYTEENLNNILESIPSLSRNVIEFREVSWWNKEVIKALKKHNLTFCNVSYPGLPEEWFYTSDKFYLRMHGVPELFKSSYTNAELKKIAQNISKVSAKSKGRFIYFNNTMFEAGYSNAYTLKAFLNK